jgi:uncharacterized protein (DUF1015 family)
MVSWPAVPLLKPFRALRYDERAAGPLDDLVAPPYDVIDPEDLDRLLARSPWNAVRLVRPDDPEKAARLLGEWQDEGVLVRDERPAVWLLEEDFTGPTASRAVGAGSSRVRLILRAGCSSHERTFSGRGARLRLARDAHEAAPIFMFTTEPPADG